MDITIGVTIPDGLQAHEIANCEELLVHGLVADNGFVMSALILRPHPIGPSRLRDSGTGYTADESTRQSR